MPNTTNIFASAWHSPGRHLRRGLVDGLEGDCLLEASQGDTVSGVLRRDELAAVVGATGAQREAVVGALALSESDPDRALNAFFDRRDDCIDGVG